MTPRGLLPTMLSWRLCFGLDLGKMFRVYLYQKDRLWATRHIQKKKWVTFPGYFYHGWEQKTIRKCYSAVYEYPSTVWIQSNQKQDPRPRLLFQCDLGSIDSIQCGLAVVGVLDTTTKVGAPDRRGVKCLSDKVPMNRISWHARAHGPQLQTTNPYLRTVWKHAFSCFFFPTFWCALRDFSVSSCGIFQ